MMFIFGSVSSFQLTSPRVEFTGRMSQVLLQEQAKKHARPFPEIRPGYTVRVHQKVQEGGKERVQIFEGLVIAVHKGRVPTDNTITVRRIVEGVGVEKIFALCSANVVKIDVVKVAKVRRAKLFFLRGRRGKAARLSERFTTADEFAVAVDDASTDSDDARDNDIVTEESAESEESTDETESTEAAEEIPVKKEEKEEKENKK